jgi:hypothetical protein
MSDLKEALLASPALRPINYESSSPVILSVDTSQLAVGYILSQCNPDNPKLRYHARFGSITLNERERRFSQPKLELYGLYRALRQLKMYLIGVRNLIIEVDAKYIKGMLRNPDIEPSASINRWIMSILMFHFDLVHVPGTHHGPDGLSRRRAQPGDEPEPEDDFDDWIDEVSGFIHMINPLPRVTPSLTETPPITSYVSEVDREESPELGPDIAETNADSATYDIIPRSDAAMQSDQRILQVQHWLQTLERPPDYSDAEFKTFMRFATEFFISEGKLWRKHPKGHEAVIAQSRRLFLMATAHNDTGHHGFYATHALLAERYWWLLI